MSSKNDTSHNESAVDHPTSSNRDPGTAPIERESGTYCGSGGTSESDAHPEGTPRSNDRALSPCERLLSDDLLLDVLSLCTPNSTYFDEEKTQPTYIHPDRWRLGNAPWIWGRVCSRWRRVLLSSPTLWQSIEISQQSGFPRSLEMLEVYLERSHDAPLYIHFGWDLDPESTWPVDKMADSIASLLIRRSCHRWLELSYLTTERIWYDSTDFTPHFPLLRSLSVPLQEDNPMIMQRSPTQLAKPKILLHSLGSLPSLARLRIIPVPHCYGRTVEKLRKYIPWDQITHFDTVPVEYYEDNFDTLQAVDATSLLQWMPNLTHCAFGPRLAEDHDYRPSLPSSTPSGSRPVDRPQLRFLDLALTPTRIVTQILSQFTFPNLTSLSTTLTALPPVADFLRRHALHLTSISITGYMTAQTDSVTSLPEIQLLSQILEEQHSLREISIKFMNPFSSPVDYSDFTDNHSICHILKSFVRTSSSDGRCPMLRKLSLTCQSLYLPSKPSDLWLSPRMTELISRIAESRDLLPNKPNADHLSTDLSTSPMPLEQLNVTFRVTDTVPVGKAAAAMKWVRSIKEEIQQKECPQSSLYRSQNRRYTRIDVALSMQFITKHGGRLFHLHENIVL